MKRSIINCIYGFIAALLIALDQISKAWIVKNLKGRDNIVWIKNVFELEYLENRGAAFSSFMGKQGFLLTLTVVILAFIIWKWFYIPNTKRFALMRISMALLFAGAVGNMIDRVSQGYVVDFFYFKPIDFPRFNVADCFVCIAMALIAVMLFFVYKDDETDFLFHIRKKRSIIK